MILTKRVEAIRVIRVRDIRGITDIGILDVMELLHQVVMAMVVAATEGALGLVLGMGLDSCGSPSRSSALAVPPVVALALPIVFHTWQVPSD